MVWSNATTTVNHNAEVSGDTLMNTEDMWNICLLALCIWREARGEPDEAKLGVAFTVKNRVRKPGWWGHTYPSVILHPYQYSSFNPNDPNAMKFPENDDTVWDECMEIAQEVYEGTASDPTDEAVNYYAASIPEPEWAKQMHFTVQLGNQKFYKAL
jgi:spore germination cell wall hydrolase CwlJ-like protein